MSVSTPGHPPGAAPLRDLLLQSATVVSGVLAGRSMTDALAAVPAPLRGGTQALSFHTMRRLGEARVLRRLLVPRTPPEPLAEALLLVALALLLVGTEEPPPADGPVPRNGTPDGAAQAATDDGQTGMPAYAPYTVVDQAVQAAAGQRRLTPFKGLINGTLRTFLRDRSALSAQLARHIEARWNHPQWWVDKLRSAYPANWESILAAANAHAPLTLRVNRRRATRDDVLTAFYRAGVAARAAGTQGIVLAQPRPVQQLPGFEEGWWSVQDAGAQLAAPLLGVADGMRVLDACAAPGGKTAHLLELADIDLLALDADPGRLRRVDENLRRLGLASARVRMQAADAADPDSWWDGTPFDAVLADVPCTASGIVRRHPDIRWLRRADDVPRTVKLQTRIVDALWRTVAPGGRLLYVTCSVFPDEGERQAAAFAARHGDAQRLQAPGQLLPTAGGDTPEGEHDGFFYALFAKAR
ncbi:16S rRNA (cytosine(967)-C(5))-methyltransferase RsmB [Bordetella genomosp. 9]|uniref:16S rRNA (Cytosine(967)-C(5))-methyltransferase n=1 Tax=Bordetella genomosp. 9 TaxID=1416803 RepID=A0A1W6Z4I7_9BORD|nr:16S rRNA (cytosine(967)-C(5))-methyltransferase RsmB [Bordetella genomosp. 9]ARP88181.1 16S rRNA (cytosine(967)-C(5))-methyltransferase [Bordetella genomosp. 9]